MDLSTFSFSVARGVINLAFLVPLLVVTFLGIVPAHASDSPYLNYIAGLSAYQKADYKNAIKFFQASQSNGNCSAENYMYMAHSYAASGNKQEAIKVYNDIVRLFKGSPAASMATQCLAKLDPASLLPKAEPSAETSSTASDPKTSRSNKPQVGFINRIDIISPTVHGHAPVQSQTVACAKSVVARLPRHIYKVLDEGNVTINIGPNISDKWPDKQNQSRPGMEEITLSQEIGRTYGRDIFLWERSTEVGSTKLSEPFSPAEIESELLIQCGHALNDCLAISADEDFKSEYTKEKSAMPDMAQRRAKLLTDDKVGASEVCALAISASLGREANRTVDKFFPKTRDLVLQKLERLGRASTVASARNTRAASSTPAVTSYSAGTRSDGKVDKSKLDKTKPGQSAAPTTPPPASTTEKEATLEMPAEEYVPYQRGLGDKLYVNGQVNGRPLQICIDTGAFKVAIGSKQLQALGIKPPQGPSKLLGGGASGAIHGWETDLDVSIGRIKRRLPVMVIDGSQFMLLGQPYFKDLHYQIDNARNYIHFTKDNKDLHKQFSYDSVEIPFRMINGNLMVAVKVNGVSVEMNFDTGAPTNMLSMTDMFKCRIRPHSSTMVRGVGGAAVPAYECILGTVELGPIRKTGQRALVSSAHSGNVLGQEFFGRMRYVVDNEKKVIRIAR